jgi:hypothetical protein
MDTQSLRFVEENNCLRLLDLAFGEPEELRYTVRSGTAADRVVVEATDLLEDQLKGWLFVVEAGAAKGRTFIIRGNQGYRPGVTNGNRCDVYFLFPMTGTAATGITNGYFVAPKDYLIMSYTSAFNPVSSVGDDLGIDGYDNLVEAWIKWKTQEQEMAGSEECMYWRGCVEREIMRIRAESLNRINKPRGRELPGLGRRV